MEQSRKLKEIEKIKIENYDLIERRAALVDEVRLLDQRITNNALRIRQLEKKEKSK